MTAPKTFSAFLRGCRLASGSLPAVLTVLREGGIDSRLALVFDDDTGESVQLSYAAEIVGAFPSPAMTADSARPIILDIRLLPRHQEWLEAQPGGASATVRRLIEAARRAPETRVSEAKTAAYRFISMVAGDFQGFEEACRAIFAGNEEHFGVATATWPSDIGVYARDLAKAAFDGNDKRYQELSSCIP